MNTARWLLLSCVVALAACSSKVTAENYDKIGPGMSRDEVHALLGKPDDASATDVGGVLSLSKETWTAGGAANVALNLAALGARCTVAGYVGPDESGAKLAQALGTKNIDVIRTPGAAQTIVKTRVMVQRQQLCRIDRESAPSAYRFTADQAESCSGETVGDSMPGVIAQACSTSSVRMS